MIIESRQNPTLKRLLELREAKGRRQQELFLIDGPREIERALLKGVEITGVYHCGEFPTPPGLLEKLKKSHKVQEVSAKAYEAVCYRENPCGVLLEAKTWPTTLQQWHIKRPTLLILAEDIEKPGNLGTLLRTADAVGADGIIGCNRTVELFNPNTLRASAGAAFSVPYATASWNEALEFLRKEGLKLVATSPGAEKDLWQANLKAPLAIAIGSEAKGLSPQAMAAADEKVRLPMRGLGDSLNVSVATGAVLYEALRQRAR